MTQSRLFRPRNLVVALATALATIALPGISTAPAQGQPPAPTSARELSEGERTRRIQERDRLRAEAIKLAQASKLDEAVLPLEKVLALTRQLRGELHEEVVGSLEMMARTHELRDDWAAARKALMEVLAIRERQPDQKDWRIADARRAVADCDRREALEPDQRQQLRESDRLNGLQDALFKQRKYAEGIDPCRKAMEIRGRLLGENHSKYATSVNNLALLYKAMGDYAKAEPLFRQASEILKRVLGEHHPRYAIILNNLAGLYRAMGDRAEASEDWAAARKAFAEALVIRQRQPEQKDWQIGDARLALADFDRRAALKPDQRQRLQEAVRLKEHARDLFAQGKHGEAIDPCSKAIQIVGELLGENHPDYAANLNNLAGLYLDIGDYAKAQPLFRRALDINKRVLGENHPNYADSLNNLAALYLHIGDYAKTESLYRQALEIRKRALGEDHRDYAQSLNNLAGLYQAMGDYAKAKPLFRQALEIRRRALGENDPKYADSLNNLAGLYMTMRDYTRAEPLYRHALEIKQRVLGENHTDYATILHNLAALHEAKGDYAKAEPLYCQALEIKKRTLGENHPSYAGSLNNLGVLFGSMGDYAKAEPLFRQALEIRKRALGENHPDYANSLNALASNYLAQGQFSAAEPFFRQGLTLLTASTQDGLAALGERQRMRLFAARVGALNSYLSVAPAAGIKAEEIYRHVLAWKGVVQARQDEDRLARDRPELRETISQLEQARARLAHLAFANPPVGQREAWVQQLDALRDRKEDLERDLALKSSVFRQFRENQRPGAAEVAAALPPGSALVDLLDYAHFSRPEGREGPLRAKKRFVAFVLRQGRGPVLVPLGASRPIDQAVRSWRATLIPSSPDAMQAAAIELNRLVWEPLKPHLEGVATVLVAPDGVLTYFPFAALPGERPGSYLVEELAIGYVSSAHRLVGLAAPSEPNAKSPEAEGAGLLAIGGIDYQADQGGAASTELALTPSVLSADSLRAGFQALAGTEPEVRRIAHLFSASFPRQHALVLTGAAPTEAAVKQQLGGHWRYLHLATHGFFESPARVAAVRAGLNLDEFVLAGPAGPQESASLALAPLLHSGMALVGAARKTDYAEPGVGSLLDREDGILTAEELQSSDLRGTELVVLSACETGLGQSYYGQGVMGLQRAFQGAGARAVMASLWRVDDAATTVLMEQFYLNLWTHKMPKLEALRQAQLTVLNQPGLVVARRAELANQRGIDPAPVKLPARGQIAAPSAGKTRSNPAFWAAFVLSGDMQ
jgi:tetratricopeptide (TPR) repeat protein/CHAT domain-containing protein